MATERVTVKLPDSFDPNRHLEALKRRIAETHEGFELTHVDMQAGKAYATRESVVLEVAENVDTETFEVKLPKGAKPGDGDRQAARLEDQYPGYYLVRFEPFLGKAVLAALSPAAVRCRLALSVALGVKAWDVQIAERTDGGFDLGLPDTYVPSKHDDKLTEVAEAVVGQLGWTFHSNPGKLTARIDPGDPPTFEPVLPYPFKTKVPGFDPTKPDWARLPLGEILGDAGAALDTITRHAAESGYAVELTDKQPSSGAYGYWQASTSKIVVWTGAADGDPAAIAHIAAHELGHAMLGHSTDEAKEDRRSDKEVAAESFAALVCAHHGIDASANSAWYIDNWRKNAGIDMTASGTGPVRSAVEAFDAYVTATA